MEKKNQFLFNAEAPAKPYEYLLVISPSKEIWDEVMGIKERFYKEHNHIQAIKSKPHITLAKFGIPVSMEEILLLRINAVAKSFEPFRVELNGIGEFPPHTIFIDIENQNSIVHLVKLLHQSLVVLPKRFFGWRPHLTIAKGLNAIKFQNAKSQLAKMEFSNSFLVDKLVLMKRKERFDRYPIVKEFELGNK
jgi:2'-5' RNA ligase